MGSHSLLQGIFPIQGSNPGLLALQADSLLFKAPGKPNTSFYFEVIKSVSKQRMRESEEIKISVLGLP